MELRVSLRPRRIDLNSHAQRKFSDSGGQRYRYIASIFLVSPICREACRLPQIKTFDLVRAFQFQRINPVGTANAPNQQDRILILVHHGGGVVQNYVWLDSVDYSQCQPYVPRDVPVTFAQGLENIFSRPYIIAETQKCNTLVNGQSVVLSDTSVPIDVT